MKKLFTILIFLSLAIVGFGQVLAPKGIKVGTTTISAATLKTLDATSSIQGQLNDIKNSDNSLNTYWGTNAFYSRKGVENVIIGYDAGYNLDTIGVSESSYEGNRNIYIGPYAGFGETTPTKNTGYFNAFVGWGAGQYNTTGYSNSFYGLKSGFRNTTGNQNIAFGEDALALNSTGNNNTAFGFHAGYNNTVSGNVFFGNVAGFGVTTGTLNVIVGSGAGSNANANSSESVLIGESAGYATSGSQNVMIGSSSGSSNTSGGGNTFVGTNSGKNSTGDNNTFFGDGVGYGNTTGQANIYLGYFSGWKQTTESNILMVDNQQRGDKATGQANAILYGIMASTAAAQTLKINARVVVPEISAALTDGAPTDTEIDTATGLTPANAGAGWQVTIKDNNGSGLLYKVESDGTNWFWTATTKAL